MSGPDEDMNITENKSHHQDEVGNDPCATPHKDASQTWWLNRRRVWIIMILFCFFFWVAAIGLMILVS